VQLLRPPAAADDLPPEFVIVDRNPNRPFLADGIIQQLDDCDPSLTFDKANVYSGRGVKLGKERVLRHVVLPYRLARSSKSFSLYERIE